MTDATLLAGLVFGYWLTANVIEPLLDARCRNADCAECARARGRLA